MMGNPLTAKQERIWRYMADHLLRHGLMPTMRELCTHCGLSATNGMSLHLDALARKGYIERPELISRGVRLLVWPAVNPDDYGEGTHARTVWNLMGGARKESDA